MDQPEIDGVKHMLHFFYSNRKASVLLSSSSIDIVQYAERLLTIYSNGKNNKQMQSK